MYWELWDIESKNLVETFASEDEALQGVREILAVNRPDLVDDLVLGATYDECESREVPLPPALVGADLRARLTETGQVSLVDDATRAVHEKIRRWLAEENWSIQDTVNPVSAFDIVVALHNGQLVRVLQLQPEFDHIVIAKQLVLGDRVRSELAQLAPRDLHDLTWTLRRDATIVGVDVDGLEPPLQTISLLTSVYFDGLTKDTLIQRVFLVLRVLSLAIHTLAHGLEQAKHPAAAAELLRLVPRSGTGDLITAAS